MGEVEICQKFPSTDGEFFIVSRRITVLSCSLRVTVNEKAKSNFLEELKANSKTFRFRATTKNAISVTHVSVSPHFFVCIMLRSPQN